MLFLKVSQVWLSLVQFDLLKVCLLDLTGIEQVLVGLRWDCTATQIVDLIGVMAEICVQLTEVVGCVLSGSCFTWWVQDRTVIRVAHVLWICSNRRASVCYDQVISFKRIWLVKEALGIRSESQDKMQSHLLRQGSLSSDFNERVKTIDSYDARSSTAR